MSEARSVDLSRCTMLECAHFNGGKAWFGYQFRCAEYPRLTRMDRYTRATKAVESTFRVDGQPVRDLKEAAEKLAIPYVPTTDDLRLLELVPDQFEKVDGRVRFLQLQTVGLVEFKNGACRLTDSGRAALRTHEANPQ
jgi:hypothetical protein